MSQENVDLVRSIYADWERGEFGATQWADPDIEFVFDGGPSPGTQTGLADTAEAMRDFIDAWSDFRVKAEDYRELDEERVLVLSNLGGSGKASRLSLGQMRSEKCELFQVRSGKVVRLVIYWDRERAVADLGLAD
jgi:ketosteroid isomerase-like protein